MYESWVLGCSAVVVLLIVFAMGISAPRRCVRAIEMMAEPDERNLPMAVLTLLSMLGPKCPSEIAFHLRVSHRRVRRFLNSTTADLLDHPIYKNGYVIRSMIREIPTRGDENLYSAVC